MHFVARQRRHDLVLLEVVHADAAGLGRRERCRVEWLVHEVLLERLNSAMVRRSRTVRLPLHVDEDGNANDDEQ